MKIHNPTSIGTLAAFTGSFSGSFKGDGSNLTGVGGGGGGVTNGTVSGSAQIKALGFQSGSNIVSSSIQLGSQISGSFTLTSSSLATRIAANETVTAKTLISSSAQVDFSGSYHLLEVKVVSDSGNAYQIDGVNRPKLTFMRGHTYRFDLSDSTNGGHPLAFKTVKNVSYSNGVIVSSSPSPGSAGAYSQIYVGYDAPVALKYYCTIHGNGMGAGIKVIDGFDTELSGSVVVSGSLKVTGDITAFSTSDERLKTNLTPILDGLDKIGEIKGYEYDWVENEHHDNEGHDIGVIAQEIEKIAPEAVVTRDNGYKAVRYEKLIPLLIQAIKELNKKIDKIG